jgi:hypothetical protein
MRVFLDLKPVYIGSQFIPSAPLLVAQQFEETQRLEMKKFEEQISATKEGFAFGHPDWKVPLQQQLNKVGIGLVRR